ncbi:MAG: hypothetical protein IPL32_05995 [Chloracidobacterium sp.]|nr:hypothetical protein [Chloracidobacterium sp.]
MNNREEFIQKLHDCRDLYLKHDGQNHELIEKEMREMGYRDFHRRSLYRRFERGTCTPGWIETYGFEWLLKQQREQQKAAAKKAKAAASADGVVLSNEPQAESYVQTTALPVVNKEASSLPDFEEFKDWLKRTWPKMTWEWKHQVYIYKHLKRITDGDSKRLMIFMPPRHGKSELVTVRYPAYMLKKDPKMKIIIGSYNQGLANRFSRMIRNALLEDRAVSEPPAAAGGLTSDPTQVRKRLPANASTRCSFSPNAQLQPPAAAGGSDWFVHTRAKNSEAEWETSEGGGVRAVGRGAGVTGYGAQLIIIDDPVKSRAEAESETFRENVWNWFNDDIYTRLAPDGKIILIQTRWHEDDLAGRLLREAAEEGGEQWDVISLPAVAEVRNSECGMRNEEKTAPFQKFRIPHSTLRIRQMRWDALPARLSAQSGLMKKLSTVFNANSALIRLPHSISKGRHRPKAVCLNVHGFAKSMRLRQT